MLREFYCVKSNLHPKEWKHEVECDLIFVLLIFLTKELVIIQKQSENWLVFLEKMAGSSIISGKNDNRWYYMIKMTMNSGHE